MKTNRRRRFERVRGAVARLPYRDEVLQDAWALFRLAGELDDDDDRLAHAVMQRALRGGDAADPAEMSVLERLIIGVVSETPRPAVPTVRERLFEEALCDDPFLRKVGRLGIERLVCKGGDVCDPAFGAERGLPKHGSVGMHVLGYPERLAVPPYEAQAQRLFARLDELRDRVNSDDPELWLAIRDATVDVAVHGELPPEGLVRDGALAMAEYDCLWQHRRGKDVKKLMAALDAVATTAGKRREAAVRRLQEILRESP